MAIRGWAFSLAALCMVQDRDVDGLLKGLSSDSAEVRTASVNSLIALGAEAETRVREKAAASEGETRLLCEFVLARIAWNRRLETELPPFRRVTIDARDRSLKEVLLDLRSQSGLPLEYGEFKDVPVTLAIKEASPLQALTAACKAANLGCFLSVDKSAKYPVMQFKAAEYADTPRFYSSHFMVEVVSVTLTRRSGRDPAGSMNLKLSWPPGVMPDQGLLDVVSIADDQGKLLYERPERAAFGASDYGGEGMPGEYRYSMSARIEFKHPGDEAERIASIRGSALVLFAGENRYLTFDAGKGSFRRPKEMAGVTAELRDIKTEENTTIVTLAHKGWPAPAMPGSRSLPIGLMAQNFRVRLRDGTTAVSSNTGTRHDGDMRVEELKFFDLKSKIASVEVLAETAFHREKFDFEFKNVPLPK